MRLLPFVFLLFLTPLAGQNSFTFFLKGLLNETGKSASVTIPAGMEISLGDKGDVYAIYFSENTDLDAPQGSAIVEQIDLPKVYLRMEYSDSPDVEALIGQGQFLWKVSTTVPESFYRSDAFHLARLGIFLTDVHETTQYYQLDELLVKDDWESSQTLLETLQKESVFVAGAMREQMDSPPVSGGRFAGSDLFTAMENADTKDIRSFLRYMQARPRKYQGTAWKFSEVFATWIDSGSPTTQDDLKDLLMEFSDDAAYSEALLKASDAANLADFSSDWRSEAEQALQKEQFDDARNLVEVALLAAQAANSELDEAWCYFSYGEIEEKLNQDGKAIARYKEAANIFEEYQAKSGLIASYNNLGNVYNKQGFYRTAIPFIKAALEMEEKMLKKNPQARMGSLIALGYFNYGTSLAGLEEYKDAIKQLEIGLDYAVCPEAICLRRRASILLKMSEVYGEMGKKRLQKSYEEQAISVYKLYQQQERG